MILFQRKNTDAPVIFFPLTVKAGRSVTFLIWDCSRPVLADSYCTWACEDVDLWGVFLKWGLAGSLEGQDAVRVAASQWCCVAGWHQILFWMYCLSDSQISDRAHVLRPFWAGSVFIANFPTLFSAVLKWKKKLRALSPQAQRLSIETWKIPAPWFIGPCNQSRRSQAHFSPSGHFETFVIQVGANMPT